MASKTTGQSGADVAAKRAAEQKAAEEKAKKRVSIQSQIQHWSTKLSEVNSQITELTTEQSNLSTYLGEWDTQKSIYDGSENLSEVVRVNVFEGVCADKIKDDFSASITEMDGTYSKVSRLNGNVGTQITRLNQYVSVIHTKLTSLRSELSSI